MNKEQGFFAAILHYRLLVLLIAIALILLAFGIATYHLNRESLAYDEGWSMWAIR